MPKSKKYDANFTAGGILFQEFSAILDMLGRKNFEELINEEINNNNHIGIAIESSRKRIIAEIKRRHNVAPKGFWNYFLKWNDSEKRLALFYLCLKTYPIVLDVHFEVAVKKYKTGSTLDDYDVQMRFDELASNNDDVSSWADITMYKLNTQYRKALKDAGLYNGSILYKPQEVQSDFWDYFKQINEQWFLKACFIENII